jgi:hypothetical protein
VEPTDKLAGAIGVNAIEDNVGVIVAVVGTAVFFEQAAMPTVKQPVSTIMRQQPMNRISFLFMVVYLSALIFVS